MVERYELCDAERERIKDIVSTPQRIGRPRRDDRQMLEGIFWILCTGAKWCDRPERFSLWKTVYDRFRIGRDEGTFDTILERLHRRLREDGLMDRATWMLDSTSIRVTQAASGGGKKGALQSL